MAPGLAEAPFDLLAFRRKEAVRLGWGEIPEWVFRSEVGTALDQRNLSRAWYRVRRKAQKEGVRPLKLHTARHTDASMALASGKSVRWVADQLGHSTPMLALKTYAHAMGEEGADLAFADFTVADGPERPPTKTGLATRSPTPRKTWWS